MCVCGGVCVCVCVGGWVVCVCVCVCVAGCGRRDRGGWKEVYTLQ